MDKRFAMILAAIVVVLGGVFWFTKDKSTTKTTGNNSTASLSNHVIGGNAKKVNLTEYGDFQCPACGAYHPVIKQVIEKYKNDIVFQFRNFPLTSLHQNARAAARAAEAADKQGKYWEMHDLLYEQQKSWETTGNASSVFEGYAAQLGLNIETYKKDYASNEVNDVINADYNEGQKLNITGTPTFFLQGKKIEDTPRDLDGFSKLIDQAIKDANKN